MAAPLEIAKACTKDDIRTNPGISVKLSALHPRYERAQQKRDRRDDVRQPVEALRRGFGEHAGAVMVNKILFDFVFRPAIRQLFANQFPPLGAGLGFAHIQGDVFANRAEQLAGNGVDLVIGGGAGGILAREGSYRQQQTDEHRYQKDNVKEAGFTLHEVLQK
jgi:hypothetical protein